MSIKSLSLFILLCLSSFQQSVMQIYGQSIGQMNTAPGLEHASIGFCVKDFSGKVIADHNMSRAYVPASTLKLVTTASALEILGSDYRYQTLLAKDKNNSNRLLIIGSGDPTLGSEHINDASTTFVDTWAEEIIRAFSGKQEIEIMVVDHLFGYQGVSRKWLHEDLGNYFAAGAYGISVFDNTYRLSFNTEKSGLAPEIIGIAPSMNNLVFTNTLTLNTTGKDNGYILGESFSNKRTIIGDIPAGRKRFTIKGDIPDPGLFLLQTISERLSRKGVRVTKMETAYDTFQKERYESNRTRYEGDVFYTHKSPVLTEIIREINVKSNNHHTEHLIRTIGRVRNNDIYSDPLEEGIEEIKQQWAKRGLGMDALFMYDGCGLAPSNGISAELMCDMLRNMQINSANAQVFMNSMPQAGKEGTVRNLLKGTRLDGKLYVKSGSIANVQCFAGYYIEGDKKYTFSIMVNNYHGPRQRVVKVIEKLLLDVLQ